MSIAMCTDMLYIIYTSVVYNSLALNIVL